MRCRSVLGRGLAGLLPALLAAAALSAAEPRGLAVTSGADDRQVLDPAEKPWRAVARLNREGSFCTAVLIGPDVALTAAHCIWHPRLQRFAPASAFHLLAGFRSGGFAAHARVLDIVVSPDFVYGAKERLSRTAADWAVLKLDSRVGDLTGFVDVDGLERPGRPLSVGDRIVQAGYSGDHRLLLTGDLDCRILKLGGPPLFYEHDCKSMKGDSGSPVFRVEQGRYSMVALHVATGHLADGRDVGIAAPVAPLLAAVRAALAAKPRGE